MSKPTLTAFYDRCERHDWFWVNADDTARYHAGAVENKALRDIAQAAGPAYSDMLVAWQTYMFSGPLFSTEDAPKPLRPSTFKGEQPAERPGQLSMLQDIWTGNPVAKEYHA